MQKTIIVTIAILAAVGGFLISACAKDDAGKTASEKKSTPESTLKESNAATAISDNQSTGLTKAAGFTLKDLNGKEISLSDFHGKVIILDFWATWCPPCVQEIPHFNELYEEYRNKGLAIIGISVDQGGIPDVEKFIKKTPIAYPVVFIENELLYNVNSLADPKSMAIMIRDAADPLSKYILNSFSKESRQLLKAYDDSKPVSESLKKVLVAELNRLLQNENIFDKQRFEHVKINADPQRLADFKPTGDKLILFNKFLLETAYRSEIAMKTSDKYQSYLPPNERGGIPYTFVIDREGYIREHYVGYRPKEVFIDAITPLL